jgi:hypothetical protein
MPGQSTSPSAAQAALKPLPERGGGEQQPSDAGQQEGWAHGSAHRSSPLSARSKADSTRWRDFSEPTHYPRVIPEHNRFVLFAAFRMNAGRRSCARWSLVVRHGDRQPVVEGVSTARLTVTARDAFGVIAGAHRRTRCGVLTIARCFNVLDNRPPQRDGCQTRGLITGAANGVERSTDR